MNTLFDQQILSKGSIRQYEKVFQLEVKFGFQFKLSKCEFLPFDLDLSLGHCIIPLGRFRISKDTNVITNMSRPHNISAVERFLTLISMGALWPPTAFPQYLWNDLS